MIKKYKKIPSIACRRIGGIGNPRRALGRGIQVLSNLETCNMVPICWARQKKLSYHLYFS
jgi:hypothetical protein